MEYTVLLFILTFVWLLVLTIILTLHITNQSSDITTLLFLEDHSREILDSTTTYSSLYVYETPVTYNIPYIGYFRIAINTDGEATLPINFRVKDKLGNILKDVAVTGKKVATVNFVTSNSGNLTLEYNTKDITYYLERLEITFR
jgi:hypothetical protein